MMPKRNEDVPDLGIDASPRGPLKLGPCHRSIVPSVALLSWSRAFWSLVGTGLTWLAWCFVATFLDGTAGPVDRDRRSDPVIERYYRQREVRIERDQEDAIREEEERAARVERLGPKLDDLSPDRRLWVSATPEEMALAWATRARPGTYRVVSARKLRFVLVATLEDTETGQFHGLRADMLPDSSEATLKLSEMRDH